MQLTARQQAIFDFIRTYTSRRGYSPTVREIGDEFGIRSPNGVMCHLKALVAKGRITRDPHVSRGLVIVGDGVHCPCCGQTLPSA